MKHNLLEEIALVDELEIENVLKAVLKRYSVLFPDWDVSTFSIRKSEDRNEQIDRHIQMLQSLKKLS